MPAISKIRLTNIVYESGDKRINDEVYLFDGNNGAIILENGGGKTVFIHTVLQAVLPHTNLGDRKIKETLQLENSPAHIGIEWVINEHPRRYVTTAVSLFMYNNELHSHRYVFEYEHDHPDRLEKIPFAISQGVGERPAYKEEIQEYYRTMKQKTHNARTFESLQSFTSYIEENYQIINDEWKSIVKINRDEGGIEKFFENCRTTMDLFDRLLIPTVEDSIAGHEKGMFADMFEKQREGFQTYRNLQESMQEHKAIQRELKTYVDEFKTFSETETAYKIVKQQAKGLAETIIDQQSVIEKEQEQNEVAWRDFKEKQRDYELKTVSFEIGKARRKAEKLERNYLEKLTQFEEVSDYVAENEQLYHSLQYANFREQFTTYEQLRDVYRQEMEQHAGQSEVYDVEAELERENAKLHGYFLTTLERFEKQIETAKVEQRPLKEMIEELTAEISRIEGQQEEEKNVFNRTEGQLETKKEQLERLTQLILANPGQEDVREEYVKWTERYQSLDEEIIRLKQVKNATEKEVAELEDGREQLLKERNELDLTIHDKERQEEQMKEAHDALLLKLSEIRPSWKSLGNLHLKEGMVAGTLMDIETKLAREREELLFKERLALRFVDDYDEQESFFTDPFLAERLTDWRNQLYVVPGPEYIADLADTDRAAYEAYPLWPLTLVTTAAEKEKLIVKVTEIKDRLQYPVSILTLEEAKQIGVMNLDETWVSPLHWEMNLNQEAFFEWKEDVRKEAEKTTVLRVDKEEELGHCKDVIQQFNEFFHMYPQEKKEKLREELRELQQDKETNRLSLEKLAQTIGQLKNNLTKLDNRMETYADERKGLERRIERATEYMQIDRERNELEKKQTEREKKIAALEKELRERSRAVERYQEETARIEERINDNRREIEIVKADSLFGEVKDFSVLYTDEAKEVLVKRREELTFKIRGIQQQYGEINEKFKQAERDISRVKVEMADVLNEYEHIDKELEFPVDGERLLERTREDVRKGKAEMKHLAEKSATAKEALVGQQTRVDVAVEQFNQEFPDRKVVEFEVDFAEVEAHLRELREKLSERKTYVEAERGRLEKEWNDLEAAYQQLDRFEEAHRFMSTAVTAISLTEKEMTDFSYNRLHVVTEMTNELRVKQEERETAINKINLAKQQFRIFCREQISERKLREMATTGIDVKTTYEDVLEFQKNMLTAVESADLYARNFISDKDKEMQAFINNMHNHLVNVTEQLRVIPKNTRVNVSGKWKEIFKFTVPEWTEEEGKSRVRDYMDWILEQLESDQYKNEQGLEDSGKVRKDVETWLDTKQLLQVVMDRQGMKVACRKVTNDNQVTSRLTSWEQSNKWSGGEKWSKNMTLFLGILNFVAEKKQHIKSNMKRHRAVILDNPFGKASSDHVLSPVFFIAEQLGFQIIALTAHADGKFLQDYFPIIYSFRLRTAIDGTTQIMTKTKSLEKAYFRDHEPEEMNRLEEREQLELF